LAEAERAVKRKAKVEKSSMVRWSLLERRKEVGVSEWNKAVVELLSLESPRMCLKPAKRTKVSI